MLVLRGAVQPVERHVGVCARAGVARERFGGELQMLLKESAGTLTSTSIDVQLAPATSTTCTSPCTDAHAADAAARLTLSRASDEKSLLVPSS
eukprot:scaffold143426_cov133-Phaeocystis_antarctica.AAC.1